MAERGGILVHLTGQPGQIAARLLARDGQAPPLPHISALTAAYVDVFAGSPLTSPSSPSTQLRLEHRTPGALTGG